MYGTQMKHVSCSRLVLAFFFFSESPSQSWWSGQVSFILNNYVETGIPNTISYQQNDFFSIWNLMPTHTHTPFYFQLIGQSISNQSRTFQSNTKNSLVHCSIHLHTIITSFVWPNLLDPIWWRKKQPVRHWRKDQTAQKTETGCIKAGEKANLRKNGKPERSLSN